jgi:hypothetical protein
VVLLFRQIDRDRRSTLIVLIRFATAARVVGGERGRTLETTKVTEQKTSVGTIREKSKKNESDSFAPAGKTRIYSSSVGALSSLV